MAKSLNLNTDVDDKTFDKKSALEWIATIEGEGASVREQDIYPLLNKWIWDNDITDVVDIGSGQGVCSSKIPVDTVYTGVEPSEFLLGRAKLHYPDANFLRGSAYELPLPSSSVTGAFSIAVWHLLSDSERAAHELSRVLKPGGHYFIVTADPQHPAWKQTPDHIFLRSETELNAVWFKHRLKTTRMGAFRSFWYFEGRKV